MSRPTPLAAENAGRANSSPGSIGAAACRSMPTNAAAPRTASAKEATTGAEPQPSPVDSMRPNVNASRAMPEVS